mmetsp:Transcript_3914/g.8199  ORF Transcript_3914/g.8199 Transcript_3914/m.8199 type:complete len:117 (-) Transcript_3914:45-395(-)
MEFDIQILLALQTPQLSNLLSKLSAKEKSCRDLCVNTQEPSGCFERCKQPSLMWEDFISEKRLIYAKRGAVFCKQSCWEATELRPCLKKCFMDYSKLFSEFQAIIQSKLEDLLTIE